MADTNVAVKDASGTNQPIDAFSQPGGDLRQAVVIGDPAAAQAASVSTTGALLTDHQAASGGTKASVAASVASTQLVAANASRKLLSVYNDSTTAILYLDATGGTASTTSYTVQLLPGDYYEMPQPGYTNAVTGIWSAAVGSARVTEHA